EIVSFAETGPFLDIPVKRYSSGMYVRLAFAVAAHMETEILLVDEVLAVGDVEFQKKCIGKMKSISRQGRTVVFVSHNLAAILSLCEGGLLLQNGRLRAEGSVSDLVEQYVKSMSSRCGGRVDLKTHPARVAGRTPLLAGIWFINAKGETTDTFACGEPATIALEFHPDRSIEQPHFGIG